MKSVIFIFIPTRYVIYLFISRVCLRSQSRESDLPVMHWCMWWGSWIFSWLCRGEARTDERVKYGNKIQKYSSNWTKFFGDKLF